MRSLIHTIHRHWPRHCRRNGSRQFSRQHSRQHSRSLAGRGFTLVELMVVLSVMVVLMSVAGPSLTSFLANNQLSAAKSGFTNAIALARSEAAKRGTSVFLRARGTPVAGNEFAAGWEIISDDDGNGSVSASDTVLRRFDALPIGLKLSGGTGLTYRATGYLSTPSDQVFVVCRASGSTDGFRVTVTPSGVADVSAISSCT